MPFVKAKPKCAGREVEKRSILADQPGEQARGDLVGSTAIVEHIIHFAMAMQVYAINYAVGYLFEPFLDSVDLWVYFFDRVPPGSVQVETG